ncbi:hypothetical protein F5Y18DRAFT_423365 [Xylariaceae sp. FL1019]|nr:hypothetical protein F5Y18DRAFT_423365 [Xylariaceae sp. FL1019]
MTVFWNALQIGAKDAARFNGKTLGHSYVPPDHLRNTKLQPARKVPDLFTRAESKDKIASGAKRQKKSEIAFNGSYPLRHQPNPPALESLI